MKRYVIFDRDGTLIEHVHHLSRIEDVVFMPMFHETLLAIHDLGFKLAIVTNQSVVGRKLAHAKDVVAINSLIDSELYRFTGIRFDFIEFCPHLPKDGCLCRKPKIGLIQKRIQNSEIDTGRSFMIGDQVSDIIFGKNAGLNTVMIRGKFGYSGNIYPPDFFINELSELPQLLISFARGDSLKPFP